MGDRTKESHNSINVCVSRVKEARSDKRITQEQLAEEIDCSVSLITQIERGKRKLTLEVAEKIAAACGVRSAWLLGLDDIKTYADQVRFESDRMLMDSNVLYLCAVIAGRELGLERVGGYSGSDIVFEAGSGTRFRLCGDEVESFTGRVLDYACFILDRMIKEKIANCDFDYE